MERKELRHDRHTVSLLTDHMVFYPKYSVSYIIKRIKGSSSRELRKAFPNLKEWCIKSLWAPSCFHGSVDHGWDVVGRYVQNQEAPNAKSVYTGSVL